MVHHSSAYGNFLHNLRIACLPCQKVGRAVYQRSNHYDCFCVDPVVSITDGKVDVVVNAASLSDQERAQIEDIVKRKTEIGADGIVITLLDVDE